MLHPDRFTYQDRPGALLDLVRTVAPEALPITVAQARGQVRLGDDDSQDDLLAGLIAVAVDHLDGYGGILGRALAPQTWALRLDRFPARYIQLPLSPLRSVASVTYLDGAGALQTLATDRYQVLDGPLARIAPAYGLTFPAARCVPRSVTVTFSAGWEVGQLPAPIAQALLIITEGLFEGGDLTELVQGRAVRALLTPWRTPKL